MRNIVRLLAIFGLLSVGVQPLKAQTTPKAVFADQTVDTKFPPGLVGTTIPSHGVEMDGTMYLASGGEPHGTVLLLHGLPGYETNGDLAQSIRRAGWNVLLFHYRETWGTAGKFSQSSTIEDTSEAVRFLREQANAAKYRIDPKRLVVIGHSFGGFLAGYEASHDQGITAVAMIAAVNLGKINADPKERESRLRRWAAQLHPVPGTNAAELFAEAATLGGLELRTVGGRVAKTSRVARRSRRSEPRGYASARAGVTTKRGGCIESCGGTDRSQLLGSSNCFANDRYRMAGEIGKTQPNR